MYVSELLGSPLVDREGRRAGRIRDAVVRVHGDEEPTLVGLLLRRRSRDLFYPLDAVAGLGQGRLTLATAAAAPTEYTRGPAELVVGRDLMDSQVIELETPRLVRVNDVLLEQVDKTWRVTAVDVGLRSLVGRLLPRRLRLHSRADRHLPWRDVELLASEVPGGGLQPDHRRLARLHPVDIARIADAVPTRQATEIVAALDVEIAADTMEEMVDQKQADVIEELDPARAAGILDRMAPDAAADVLAELQPEVVDAVLQRMAPTEAADVHALLTYPKDTAGGLMTTDVVVAPRGLPIAEAANYLRPQLEKPDLVYYVYVVDDLQERRLAGVFSLRDLLLADPAQRVDDIMTPAVRRIAPDVPAPTVAQSMSEYNLMAIPVTDDQGRLLGVVSVDDAVEVILPDELRRRVPRVFS